MSEELKPVRCGCGGEAKVYHWNHDPDIEDWYGVRCSKCHINISMGKNREPFWTAKDAIEAWNTAMGERTAKITTVEKPIEGSVRTISVMACENCENVVSIFDSYCSGCGARLEWNE